MGKRLRSLVLWAPCALSLSACAPVMRLIDPDRPSYLDPEVVDWEYIQSVGGLTIGDPWLDPPTLRLYIPLVMDLSGNKRITVEPTRRDTGKACYKVEKVSKARLLPGSPVDLEITVAQLDTGDFPNPNPHERSCATFVYQMSLLSVEAVDTFRLWYRDGLFDKHLIAEFSI